MPPFPTRVQDNSNVYHDRLFREIAYTAFLEDLKTKTVSSKIANIHLNEFGAVIRQPELDRSKIVVGETDAYNCEIGVNSTIETSEDIVTMDKQFYTAVEICDFDEAYTEVNLTDAARKEMNYKMTLKVDAYILAEAVAQATESAPAITDAATAQSVTDLVEATFIGYESVPGTRVIVAGQSLYPFFKQLFVDRTTVLGDQVFLSGQLQTIAGWEICFVADSQMVDATQVIYAIGKPLDLWLDEAGFMSGSRWKQGTTPTDINFNQIYYRTLNAVAKLWSSNEPRLVVTAAVV